MKLKTTKTLWEFLEFIVGISDIDVSQYLHV
jgi:hypothetical protein